MTIIKSFNTGYSGVIKTNDPAKSGIIDKKSTDDKVIDLSDPSRIAAELKQKNAEFIKVKDNLYIKLDLNDPEKVNKLLENLRTSILSEDGSKVLENFDLVSFSEDKGITVQKVERLNKAEETPKPVTKDIPAFASEDGKTFTEITALREKLKTVPAHKPEHKEIEKQIKDKVLSLVRPSMKADVETLLNIPPGKMLFAKESKQIIDLINQHKQNNTLKEFMLTFDTLNPDNTLRDIIEQIPSSGQNKEPLALLESIRKEIIPEPFDNTALPQGKVSKEAAVAQLDLLAAKVPDIKELLNKMEHDKGSGKSLRLMGITKEDLAVYLATGQQSEKMEAAMRKAMSTGDWPAVNSVIEITRLHRSALQERVKELRGQVDQEYQKLSVATTPEQKTQIRENLFKLTSQMDEIENIIEQDTKTLKTVPDAATRARTSVSQQAISKFDSQLSKLAPDSTEYARIKSLRDAQHSSLKSDARAIDERIANREKNGKAVSSDLKNMSVSVHKATYSSSISSYELDVKNTKAKGGLQVESPQSPPPPNPNLVEAEEHLAKAEKYTDHPEKDMGLQDMRLTLHQAKRQDIKDRLQATGVTYDEKGKVFKHPVSKEYEPPTMSGGQPEPEVNFSSGMSVSSPDDGKRVVSDAQKQLEQDYHDNGLKMIHTIHNQKAIIKSELPPADAPEPTDPKEKVAQQAKVDKLARLEDTETNIKTEHAKVLLEEAKAAKRVSDSEESLNGKTQKLTQIGKQKEALKAEIKALEDNLGAKKAEVDDWADNYIFTNDSKQKELNDAIEKGKNKLALKQKMLDGLSEQEEKLQPQMSLGTDDLVPGSIADAEEKGRVSYGERDGASAQADALRKAYAANPGITSVSQVNLVSITDQAKQSIESANKVYKDPSLPTWMTETPAFKAAKVSHDFSSVSQRNELSESVAFIAAAEVRNKPSTETTAKVNASAADAGSAAKQKWDTGSVTLLDQAEAERVALSKIPAETGLSEEENIQLAAKSIRSQTDTARNIADTVPEETLRLLGRAYETAGLEIPAAALGSTSKLPLQAELLNEIGLTAAACVGPAFRRDMVFKGQQALTEGKINAAQDLLGLAAIVQQKLKQDGFPEEAGKIGEFRQKWDNAIKGAYQEAKDHLAEIKKEKEMVISAFEFDIYETKEAANGHTIAAAMWKFRDKLEADDPAAWAELALMTSMMPGVNVLVTFRAYMSIADNVILDNKKKDTSKAEFDYDKIDLEKLDKSKASIEGKYDRGITEMESFIQGFGKALEDNKGLAFLSAMKVLHEGLEPDGNIPPEYAQAIKLSKQILGTYPGMDKFINPKLNEGEKEKDVFEPAIKNWLAKGGPSESGSGFAEAAHEVAQNGSLVAGGYDKEFADAQAMMTRYMGMSVTDVLGVDTQGWEFQNKNLLWLNSVGSFLNKTDTVALIVEIAVTEALTAGAGTALAAARLGRLVELVTKYPQLEKAIAMAKAVGSFLPSVISGERKAASAMRLIIDVAKHEKDVVRAVAGIRKVGEIAQVGGKLSRAQQVLAGTVHMGQIMAVQAGMNYGAQKAFGEHSFAAKMVEFGSQLLFVGAADKFAGIKNFSGRLGMNIAIAYGQQNVGKFAEYAITKAMELGSDKPLTPEQKHEIKKWGERIAIATSIVVPTIISTSHKAPASKEQIKEMSSLQAESLAPKLGKDTPQFKELTEALSTYHQETGNHDIPADKLKKEIKALHDVIETMPPDVREKAHKFLAEESIKIAMKQMPDIYTKDPVVFGKHIEENLINMNGKDGFPKYDTAQIAHVVREQMVKKTMEGVNKLEPDLDNLTGKKGTEAQKTEEAKLINTVREQHAQLIEKFEKLPGYDKAEAKLLADLSVKSALEQMVAKPGLNTEGVLAVLKSAKEVNMEIAMNIRVEGKIHLEYGAKLVKNQHGVDELVLTRPGLDPVHLKIDEINKLAMENGAFSIDLKAEKLHTDVEQLFGTHNLDTPEKFNQFAKENKEQISEFLSKNIDKPEIMQEFYKKAGGWDNIKGLQDKIPEKLFDKIHEARDKMLADTWAEVKAEAKSKGFDLEDPYVGTKPGADGYKKVWSDVDFSVKIIKSNEAMSPAQKHIAELELMQMMQKKLQDKFDGAPSKLVDSNAYATPLIMDIKLNKSDALSPELAKKDWDNIRATDFYQIRLGYGHSEAGKAAYNKFKEEAINMAKTPESKKEIADNFAKAEDSYHTLQDELNLEIAKIKENPKNRGKSEDVLNEMALTNLRFKKENDLISFVKDNESKLNDHGPVGQEARIEFNKIAREMRMFWPEAYVSDMAAKWGSSGDSMSSVAQGMSMSQKMQVRVSQEQFKMHWVFDGHSTKDLATVVMKLGKYDVREIYFRELQMNQSSEGKSGYKFVENIARDPHLASMEKEVKRLERTVDFYHENGNTVKAEQAKKLLDAKKQEVREFIETKQVLVPENGNYSNFDRTFAAVMEVKQYAKNPAEAEKIWMKYFSHEPNPKEAARQAMESYINTVQHISEVALLSHVVKPLRDN